MRCSSSVWLLLSIAAFMLLLLSCTPSLVHAKYVFKERFQGLTCSGKPIKQVYTYLFNCSLPDSYDCRNETNSYSSVKSSCLATLPPIPLSPKAGEYMMIGFTDWDCSDPVLVVKSALNTCIPRKDGSSYMYKGCTFKVTYSDQNCQTEIRNETVTTFDCDNGMSVQCNNTVQPINSIPEHSFQPSNSTPRNSTHPKSSFSTYISGSATEFMLRSSLGIVVSMMVAVLIMTIFYM
ncbi:hypothetical protein FDP41_003828 [Naegleria fowleri]|uniref:SUEL-type lectin domain-containing protein n=1 Tax=Naegleria fowleri TaxID=5763 RepID=A0A6A5BV17_NAEFO|nr:uncharacterized protein FDP41_003828 [Naegleria fowleri]KAF0977175.1 hypothetical protein FDP41_003828 [Naegleria fowleri]